MFRKNSFNSIVVKWSNLLLSRISHTNRIECTVSLHKCYLCPSISVWFSLSIVCSIERKYDLNRLEVVFQWRNNPYGKLMPFIALRWYVSKEQRCIRKRLQSQFKTKKKSIQRWLPFFFKYLNSVSRIKQRIDFKLDFLGN